MKKVFLIDGGKGGVGKSTTAALIVDKMLNDGCAPRIVEADGTVPDVGRRFARHGVQIAMAPLAGKTATADRVIAVFDRVFEGEDDVVLNLPAGAGEVLDQHAALIGDASEAAGIELVHVWVVGADQASADLAMASMNDGLASVAARRVVVLNEHHGEAAALPWARHPARAQWQNAGAVECVLPRLPQIVREETDNRGYREALPHLSVMQIVALKHWLRAADKIVNAVVGDA